VVQRYLTTRDARTARRAYLLNAISSSSVALILALAGAALLAFYQHNPASMPPGATFAKNGDAFFPHFISHFLPPGISGLVVAGILAAAMSGLSSGINSITTVVAKDLVEVFRPGQRTERAKVRMARFIAFTVGTVVVLGSLGMGLVRGNLTEVSGKTDRLFTCPIFGIFFLAMFVPYSTAFGAVMGLVYSLSAAILVGYWDVLTGLPKLSFQWIQPVSLLVSIGAGCLFSLLPTRGRKWPVLAGYSAVVLAPLAAVFIWVIRSGTAIGWY
jgi:Na+/proline symporter